MSRRLIILAIAAPLALFGCGGTTSDPPVLSNSVAAAEIALTNAERMALRYTSLPRCGTPTAPPVCSDPATVQRIKDADNKAYDAVIAARRNEALIGFALSAIDAFGGIIPK